MSYFSIVFMLKKEQISQAVADIELKNLGFHQLDKLYSYFVYECRESAMARLKKNILRKYEWHSKALFNRVSMEEEHTHTHTQSSYVSILWHDLPVEFLWSCTTMEHKVSFFCFMEQKTHGFCSVWVTYRANRWKSQTARRPAWQTSLILRQLWLHILLLPVTVWWF